jgi:hypothetical protein
LWWSNFCGMYFTPLCYYGASYSRLQQVTACVFHPFVLLCSKLQHITACYSRLQQVTAGSVYTALTVLVAGISLSLLYSGVCMHVAYSFPISDPFSGCRVAETVLQGYQEGGLLWHFLPPILINLITVSKNFSTCHLFQTITFATYTRNFIHGGPLMTIHGVSLLTAKNTVF